ncbi:leucyl aminopeptidase [Candidatus Campbellbacteria bacterium]|nr:MAG: leucyl aminopeptidase [Candidatus Campbellbacteria bacterium]
MKLKYNKENQKGFRMINFYQKENQKKEDTKNEKFLNFKTEKIESISDLVLSVRGAVLRAKSHKQEKISFNYSQIQNFEIKNVSESLKAKLFAENILLSWYKFDKYKTKKENSLKEVLVFGDFLKTEKEGFKKGQKTAEAVNFARDLANTPANDMTPDVFVSEVKKEFKGNKKVKVKVLNQSDILKKKMGLLDAVSKGSLNKPKLLVLEYFNAKNKKEKPTVLVGKGVCYDTGGLSLKPTDGMVNMSKDMTGASVVVSVLKNLISLNLNKNIVVVTPLVENSVSGNSYRPGDILKSMSGITVEVLNTDAEGRLILADAITYAKKYKPKMLLDVATLTGAALMAVGENATVFITQNDELENTLREIGQETFNRVWRLPSWAVYEKKLKSNYADIVNTATTKWGGTITAGMFLYQFVKDYKKDEPKWVHFDMAPRMESVPEDSLEKGSTGEPVSLIVEFLKKNV